MAGNANSGNKRDKIFADAIRVAVNRVQEGDPLGRKKLFVLTEKIVDLAVAGDLEAAKIVGDRLDGKAVQAIAGDAMEPLRVVVQHLTRAVTSE